MYMDKEKILETVRDLPCAETDYPFEEDFETAVFRRKDSRKWFGVYLAVPKRYFGEGEGSEFCLNLKCPPDLSAILQANFAGILPGWHMNNTHWVTVRPERVPDGETEKLIRLSYEIVGKAKKTGSGRKKL